MPLLPSLARAALWTARRWSSANPFAAAVLGGPKAALPYESGHYDDIFRESVTHPEEFWARQAQRVVWHTEPQAILDNSNPPFSKWFVGGELSTCYNALDRHVEAGLGDMEILIHDSPITQSLQRFTYSQILDEVKRVSGALRALGVERGDRVLIYMPMIPQTLMAIMAVNRLAATHIIVFGGFAAKELAVRISHTRPKVVITASCGLEPNKIIEYKPIVDEAIGLSDWTPKHCLVYKRPDQSITPALQPGRDLDWAAAAGSSVPVEDCVPQGAQDPVYVLHTSGTTGTPKGIVRPSAGHCVVLPWSMQTLYGMRPGETWWAASDFGWVVGHSYTAYAPLLYAARTIIFEGKPVGTPDSGQYFRVISDHDVASMFCAPTALRAIHQYDPEALEGKKYPLRALRVVFSAGEKLDVDTRAWAEANLGVPVADHWWQSESGWPICCPSTGLSGADIHPARDVSGKPTPGWNVQLLGYQQTHGSGSLIWMVLKLLRRFMENFFHRFDWI